MDEYARHFYMRIGNAGTGSDDIGDISDRVNLRKNLECASFQWYLENVYPELDVPNNYAEGSVTNNGMSKDSCLDSNIASGDTRFQNCHGLGRTQFFELTKNNEIRRNSHCLDFTTELEFYHCNLNRLNQEWILNVSSHQIIHKVSKKCLTADSKNNTIIVEDCDLNNENQKWNFQYFYEEKFLKEFH